MNQSLSQKKAVFLFLFVQSLLLPMVLQAQRQRVINGLIDFQQPQQKIEGFGASDAWSCQFAGLWPEDKKNKIADLLFSRTLDKNGNPLGIGLNFWRFSIGGGSAEQGAASGIHDEWRRQSAFLKTDGSYDDNAMPGQMWFVNAAKKRGVKNFIGFVNSPHINFTLNGKAFSSDGKCNLDFSKLDAFSLDLTNNINIIKKNTDIELSYVSPVNEPQWKWNEGNQEGCPYTNQELFKVVKSLSEALNKAKLNTKIQIAEAGQLDYLTNHPDTAKSKQIAYFFKPSSAGYLGKVSNLDKSISGHSYFTTSPEQKSIGIRNQVRQEVSKYKNLRFWMSEYCVLGDDLLEGNGRDLGMKTALFIAKLIHHDLTYANATSWQWWLAVSVGDYKDGLIYIDKSKTDGNIYPSKLLWAFGNYSRFIPEGSRRLTVKTDDEKGFYLSSYQSRDEIISVAINNSDEIIHLQLSGLNTKHKTITTYTTSDKFDLQKGTSDVSKINLPARSVTTLIGMR